MTDTVEKYLEKQKAKEKPLRLVLTDHWFEEIKSGRKTALEQEDAFRKVVDW